MVPSPLKQLLLAMGVILSHLVNEHFKISVFLLLLGYFLLLFVKILL